MAQGLQAKELAYKVRLEQDKQRAEIRKIRSEHFAAETAAALAQGDGDEPAEPAPKAKAKKAAA